MFYHRPYTLCDQDDEWFLLVVRVTWVALDQLRSNARPLTFGPLGSTSISLSQWAGHVMTSLSNQHREHASCALTLPWLFVRCLQSIETWNQTWISSSLNKIISKLIRCRLPKNSCKCRRNWWWEWESNAEYKAVGGGRGLSKVGKSMLTVQQ